MSHDRDSGDPDAPLQAGQAHRAGASQRCHKDDTAGAAGHRRCESAALAVEMLPRSARSSRHGGTASRRVAICIWNSMAHAPRLMRKVARIEAVQAAAHRLVLVSDDLYRLPERYDVDVQRPAQEPAAAVTEA